MKKDLVKGRETHGTLVCYAGIRKRTHVCKSPSKSKEEAERKIKKQKEREFKKEERATPIRFVASNATRPHGHIPTSLNTTSHLPKKSLWLIAIFIISSNFLIRLDNRLFSPSLCLSPFHEKEQVWNQKLSKVNYEYLRRFIDFIEVRILRCVTKDFVTIHRQFLQEHYNSHQITIDPISLSLSYFVSFKKQRIRDARQKIVKIVLLFFDVL